MLYGFMQVIILFSQALFSLQLCIVSLHQRGGSSGELT